MDSFTIAARIAEDIRTFRNNHNDADQRLAEYAALVDQETHIPEEEHDKEIGDLKDDLKLAKSAANGLDKLAYKIRDILQDDAAKGFPRNGDIHGLCYTLFKIAAEIQEADTDILIDLDAIDQALDRWQETQPKPEASAQPTATPSEHQTPPPTTRSLPFLTRQAA